MSSDPDRSRPLTPALSPSTGRGGTVADIEPSVPDQLRATSPQRFHQLDGLRAVAVLLVMAHHAFKSAITGFLQSRGLPYAGNLLFVTTQSGVELFFVLSGVVLLRPYARRSRPFAPGQYFLRRFQRLWPPYLVVLAAEGAITWAGTRWPTWFTHDAQRPQFSLLGWASQLGIVSFGWRQYNTAWWSLTVEVLFYILVPVLIPLLAARRIGKLWWVAALFAVLGFAAMVSRWDERLSSAGWHALLLLLIYSPCFLLGMIIAKFDWPPRVGWALVGVGLAYVLAAVRFPPLNVHAGFGLLYAGLVMASFARDGSLCRFLASDLMVWIGERSYSLFLFHFTAFAGVNWLVSLISPDKDLGYFVVTRFVGISVAFLGAMLIFHFVERRFARNLVTAHQFWPPLGGEEPADDDDDAGAQEEPRVR